MCWMLSVGGGDFVSLVVKGEGVCERVMMNGEVLMS